MEINPIRIIQLENGLTLPLYDASRKLAGDRWLVALIARVEIPVDGLKLGSAGSVCLNAAEVRKALGNRVVFEQKRERIFIDELRMQETFQSLCDSFLSRLVAYISIPDFAEKYIQKLYRDYRQRESWSRKD